MVIRWRRSGDGRGAVTPEELQALVDGGETPTVEFKSDAGEGLSDHALVDAVVCLANSDFGASAWLLIGVEDDGQISGVHPDRERGRADLNRVRALIASRTQPALAVRPVLTATPAGDVLAIEVPAAPTPTATSGGRFLRRTIGGDGKPNCRPFYFHEMQAQRADRGQLDYSAQRLVDVGFDALDPLEFERYRRSIQENQGDHLLIDLGNPELARALGAVQVEDGREIVTVLGLLLFGRDAALVSALPAHEVAFQALSGSVVEVNDFFRWPLLRVMEELEGRFRARNSEREIQVGMTRVGVPAYSPRVFREAVANALTHRDYTRLGAVHVQWREDRIEVSSPGGFPQGVRLDNLLVAQPSPRNLRLADAFKRAGLVERTARGIDMLFEQQVRTGRAVPSYGRSTEVGVVLVLPGGEPDMRFVRFVVEEERERGRLPLDDLLILSYLQGEPWIATAEVVARVQKPEAEARAALLRLRERGLLEPRGASSGGVWRLSEALRRRLNAQGDDRSAQALDLREREQLVLEYARQYGRVTRRDAAALCRMSPRQASYVLSRLVHSGDLVMHGKRRGAWYEPK